MRGAAATDSMTRRVPQIRIDVFNGATVDGPSAITTHVMPKGGDLALFGTAARGRRRRC